VVVNTIPECLDNARARHAPETQADSARDPAAPEGTRRALAEAAPLP